MDEGGIARSRCISSTNQSAHEDTTWLVPKKSLLEGDDL
jgi:hypothetical protein